MIYYYNYSYDDIPLYPVYQHMKQLCITVNNIIKTVKKHKLHKQEIVLWCRGSSGAAIAALIAAKLPNCSIVHVKKHREEHHYSDLDIKQKAYNVFVDDFISSGTTLKEVIKTINDYDLKLNAIWLCNSKSFDSNKLIQIIEQYNGIYANPS